MLVSNGGGGGADSPAGPRLRSNAACHSPVFCIFSMASLIFWRNSLSPLSNPMPYFSTENGLPTSLNAPGVWAA
ncbi:Uncharacterised protein [Mycobacteroides abscessus subsp. abscessus]|nr:Uncharacterised protein [Mycobacteroides abscessus subsp. abscessus]